MKEDLKGMTERPTFETDLLIDDSSLILFFPFCHQIITKIGIWMLAEGRTTKTRKTDIASKLPHDSSDDSFIYIHFTLSSGILNVICFVRLPALFDA